MEPRQQFTFFRSYYTSITRLPKKQQAEILLAVCAYALNGEEPKGLSVVAATCFDLMRPILDRGIEKASNGAKGGKAGGKQDERKGEANGKQTGSKPEAKQKQTGSKTKANGKQTASNKEKEVEVEKEVDKEKDKEREMDKEEDKDMEKDLSVADAAEREKEGETEAPSPENPAQKLRMLRGELGKGVIALTDEQMEDLLDRMGLEVFDHYVGKLSDFILRKGAKVKSHYETILKWWREDSQIQE